MSTTFIATLVVRQGKEAEFERLQKELSELSHREEPDLAVYDVIKHREKPRTYVVYGRWKSEAAFQAHMSSPSHERLVPPILACLEGAMDLQMFDWKS
ncbi:MAG TPA: antibiotic biosynthesis monooxygenase family protein [Steroidobacteraceae bacterium]|nr:antibiotic biosynthesis monooxygenase family protein [Steroidobacteraceae bacterium]